MYRGLTVLLLVVILSFSVAMVKGEEQTDLRFLSNLIDVNQAYTETLYFAQIGSRITCYPGYETAAKYIKEKFNKYGLTIYVQNYSIAIPIDFGATIKIFGESTNFNITAYSLWPNLVQSCPAHNLSGRLVYIGSGDLREMEGLDLKNSFAIMEFNSGYNWLNAAKLGAKGVIFIAPNLTNRIEAEEKFLMTPLYFPRLYVSQADGEVLRTLASSKNITVSIDAKIVYEERVAQNVIGILWGSDKSKDEIIIIGTHFDTWSIVPALAYGDDEAVNIGSLIEIARILSNYKPKRTVIFAALSGHWEALAGARAFTEAFLFKGVDINGKTFKVDKPVFIGLDLSTDSDSVAYVFRTPTGAYNYDRYGPRWVPMYDLVRKYLPQLESIGLSKSKIGDGFTVGWENQFAITYRLDGEPILVAGCISLSIVTTQCYRLNWGIPMRTTINMENLKPQLIFASCVIWLVANEDLSINWSISSPQRSWSQGDVCAGMASLTIRVVEYDPQSGSYIPVPNALVTLRIGDGSRRYDPFTYVIRRADKNGIVEIEGLRHALSYRGIHDVAAVSPGSVGYDVRAYVINDENGTIDKAPDLGQYGDRTFGFTTVILWQENYPATTVVFNSGTIVLYDITDPRTHWSPRISVHTRVPWQLPILTITVNDFRTHSPLLTYGLVTPDITCEPLAMVFVPPNIRFEIQINGGTERALVGILINATETSPSGMGYEIGTRKTLIMPLTAFTFLSNLITLNRGRLETVESYGVHSYPAEQAKIKTDDYYAKAKLALDAKDYARAYSMILNAWNWETITYVETKNLIVDTIDTTVFFFAFLIPFTILAEALFFSTFGKRRLIAIIVIFIASFLPFYLAHPGLHIAGNVLGTLIGLVVELLTIPVFAVLLNQIMGYVKELRQRIMGIHFAEVSRSSAFMLAFTLGISNMRRRKLRTALMLVSIVIITFSLISLSSISGITFARSMQISFQEKPPYEGLLLKYSIMEAMAAGAGSQVVPVPSMHTDIVNRLRGLLGPDSIIVCRSWFWAPPPEYRFQIQGRNGTATIMAIIGLEPEEEEILSLRKVLLNGTFFEAFDYKSCILPMEIAEKLNANPGDVVNFFGFNLVVKGIIDTKLISNLFDIDGLPLTPVDRVLLGEGQIAYLPWSYVMIVPFKLALDLDGGIYSVVAKVQKLELAREAASELVMGTNLQTYVSSVEGVEYYGRGTGYVTLGWELLSIPFIIGSLTIFNLMITIVMERHREISILSAVGFSPIHVAGLFIAEALVYAIFGASLGYITGIVGANVLTAMKAFPPGFFPNYASIMAIVAAVLPIVATLVSSLYPIFRASRLVTPSLERRWRIPTKPKGRSWEVPLPFRAQEEETRGIISYLKEFLESHAIEAGTFASSNISVYEIIGERGPIIKISAIVKLKPFELGVSQTVELVASPDEKKTYNFNLYLSHATGDRRTWVTSNYFFVDEIRKQFLIWRGLRIEDKQKYIKSTEVKNIG